MERHRSGFYGQLRELRNRLARARHFRGHGVHSPYIYNIVREVFMCRELKPGPRDLYDALIGAGVDERRAVQLQNLAIHCGFENFGINCADADLCVVTTGMPYDQVLALTARASAAGHAVAVLSPCDLNEHRVLWQQIVAAHPSTTVDNRAYMLIFNNHLPKQHFRL